MWQVRVRGILDPAWEHRFAGWAIRHEDPDTTLLVGPHVDQSGLAALLRGLLDLNIELLSATKVQGGDHDTDP